MLRVGRAELKPRSGAAIRGARLTAFQPARFTDCAIARADRVGAARPSHAITQGAYVAVRGRLAVGATFDPVNDEDEGDADAMREGVGAQSNLAREDRARNCGGVNATLTSRVAFGDNARSRRSSGYCLMRKLS